MVTKSTQKMWKEQSSYHRLNTAALRQCFRSRWRLRTLTEL